MNIEELNSIEIIPLLDTLKLSKIDDDTYFSTKYSGYISNSRLSLIDPNKGGSPEKFFKGFKSTYNPSFDIGSAIHQLTLQKDLFYLVDDLYKPTAKIGALADKLYPIFCKKEITDNDIINAAVEIDYYKGNLDEKKLSNVRNKCVSYWTNRRLFESSYEGDKQLIYLDSKSLYTVSNCVTALNNNQYIQNLLHPSGLINPIFSENEQAILLDLQVNIPNCKSFILKFKAKLDNYTIDQDMNIITVNDIKSISKVVSEIYNNIKNYSYNRELSIYSWLLSLCAKKYYTLDNPLIKANYLVVSTIPQYYTKVVHVTKSMFNEGWREFQYLIRLVAYYYNKGYRFNGV